MYIIHFLTFGKPYRDLAFVVQGDGAGARGFGGTKLSKTPYRLQRCLNYIGYTREPEIICKSYFPT